jgi:hypothetical protein
MHHLYCNRDGTTRNTAYMRKYFIVAKREQDNHLQKKADYLRVKTQIWQHVFIYIYFLLLLHHSKRKTKGEEPSRIFL